MQVSAKVCSQRNATLNLDHVEISKAPRVIEKKSEYRFLYNDALLSLDMTVKIHATNARVTDVVGHILSGTPLTYNLIGTHLIVIAASNSKILVFRLKGQVSNPTSNPLVGVTIQVKGTTIQTLYFALFLFFLCSGPRQLAGKKPAVLFSKNIIFACV